MADAARHVTDHLREGLADRLPGHEWRLEYALGDTRVDLAGLGGPPVFVELEWRRADPVNNTISLLRAFASDDAAPDRAIVAQVFTRYYDLSSGGTSTRRRNAEYAGHLAEEGVTGVTYCPVTLDVTPARGGDALPTGWRAAVAPVATTIADAVVASTT